MVSATSTNTLTSKSNSVNLDSRQQTGVKQMIATEILAAKDVRVLDVIEDFLLNYRYDVDMTDDLVFAIQEYLQNNSDENKQVLIAKLDMSQLSLLHGFKFHKFIAQLKETEGFLNLVAENPVPETKPIEVVAVATTAAEVVSSKPDKPSAKTKTPKSKQLLPMPTIASIAELEALDRRGLMDSVKALNDHIVTGIRANAATDALKITLAKHVLKLDNYKPSAKVKPGKAPKTSKGNTEKTPIIRKEDIDLSTLTWEDCRDMSYRQLQQVCGALKAQKLFTGNCGGKGATKDNFMKGIADYFRGKGVSVVEVTMTQSKTTQVKPLSLPNLAAVRADQKLAVAA